MIAELRSISAHGRFRASRQFLKSVHEADLPHACDGIFSDRKSAPIGSVSDTKVAIPDIFRERELSATHQHPQKRISVVAGRSRAPLKRVARRIRA
jgi:hypothetical protein